MQCSVGAMAADCEIERCGVLAMGRCGQCHRAFCSSHQGISDRAPGLPSLGQVIYTDVCSACARRLEEVAAEHRRLEKSGVLQEQRLQEVHLRRQHEWAGERDALLAAAMSHTDVVERLLLAARHWLPNLREYSPLDSRRSKPVDQTRTDLILWASAFPTFWATPEQVSLGDATPAWPSPQIASWVADRAIRQGLRPNQEYGKDSLFPWIARKRGWFFDGSIRNQGRSFGARIDEPGVVIVTRDGGLVYDPETGSCFGPAGLQEMAGMLGLTDERMQSSVL